MVNCCLVDITLSVVKDVSLGGVLVFCGILFDTVHLLETAIILTHETSRDQVLLDTTQFICFKFMILAIQSAP